MGTEGLAGTIFGTAVGMPELGSAFESMNVASKALVTATEDVPGIGDLVKGAEDVMDAVKEVPVAGDIIDLFF